MWIVNFERGGRGRRWMVFNRFCEFCAERRGEEGREIAQKITSVIIAEFRRDLFARRRRIR